MSMEHASLQRPVLTEDLRPSLPQPGFCPSQAAGSTLCLRALLIQPLTSQLRQHLLPKLIFNFSYPFILFPPSCLNVFSFSIFLLEIYHTYFQSLVCTLSSTFQWAVNRTEKGGYKRGSTGGVWRHVPTILAERSQGQGQPGLTERWRKEGKDRDGSKEERLLSAMSI